MQQYIYKISGLYALDAVDQIEKQTRQLVGVSGVCVDYSTKTLTAMVDSQEVLTFLVSAVSQLGFSLEKAPETILTTLFVPNLRAKLRLEQVRKVLSGVNGIQDVTVRVSTDEMIISHDPNVAQALLLCTLNNAGISASLSKYNHSVDDGYSTLLKNTILFFGCLATLAGVLLESFGPGIDSFWPSVLFITGLLFFTPLLFKRAIYDSITKNQFDFSTFFVVAIMGWLFLYQWREAGFIAAVCCVIFVIEARIKQKNQESLSLFTHLLSSIARLQTPHGVVTVPVEEIVKGDVVIVKSGENIPVDGNVINGSGTISDVFGSEMQTHKRTCLGDRVFAGSQILSGTVSIQADTLQSESAVNLAIEKATRILQQDTLWDHQAQKIVCYLAWAGVALSASYLMIRWFYAGGIVATDIETALLFLIIASGMPVLLVVKTIFLSGVSFLVSLGVVFQSDDTWLRLSQARRIIVNKFGFLSTKQKEVYEVIALGSMTIKDVFSIAASLSALTDCAAYAAIRSRALKDDIKMHDVQAVTHYDYEGVSANIGGRQFFLGSYRFIKQLNLVTDQITSKIRRWEDDSTTAIFLADDSQIIGMLTILNPLRDSSQTLFDHLKQQGIIDEFVLISDDSGYSTQVLQQRLGVDSAYSDMGAHDKAQCIARHIAMSDDMHVIMSDDANAICRTDNCLSWMIDARLFKERIKQSDIAMLGHDLSRIPRVFMHAHHVVWRLQQTLLTVITYKVILFGLVFAGLVNLWVIAAAELLMIGWLFTNVSSVSSGSYTEEVDPDLLEENVSWSSRL